MTCLPYFFYDIIHWCQYNLALADVWSTGAGITCLYCMDSCFAATAVIKVIFFCKVRNINMEVILTTSSGSDSLISRSVNMCSILYSKCASSKNDTWSVDNHTYIHRHTYMYVQPNLNDARNHGGSEFLNCNIPVRTGVHLHVSSIKSRVVILD